MAKIRAMRGKKYNKKGKKSSKGRGKKLKSFLKRNYKPITGSI